MTSRREEEDEKEEEEEEQYLGKLGQLPSSCTTVWAAFCQCYMDLSPLMEFVLKRPCAADKTLA